jgi:hypothetical protein
MAGNTGQIGMVVFYVPDMILTSFCLWPMYFFTTFTCNYKVFSNAITSTSFISISDVLGNPKDKCQPLEKSGVCPNYM